MLDHTWRNNASNLVQKCLCIIKNSSLIKQIMTTELLCMNIRGKKMLVQLFPSTILDEEKGTLFFTKYGKITLSTEKPYNMDNRGSTGTRFTL